MSGRGEFDVGVIALSFRRYGREAAHFELMSRRKIPSSKQLRVPSTHFCQKESTFLQYRTRAYRFARVGRLLRPSTLRPVSTLSQSFVMAMTRPMVLVTAVHDEAQEHCLAPCPNPPGQVLQHSSSNLPDPVFWACIASRHVLRKLKRTTLLLRHVVCSNECLSL
jgi:hypothetical protein